MQDDFEPYDEVFLQPDAVQLTGVDKETLNNWVRHKHVLPKQIGNRRFYSFLDLLKVKLTWTLQQTFRAEVSASYFIASQAVKEYADRAVADWHDISAGASYSRMTSDPGRATFNLTRGEDGQLRAFKRDDLEMDSVMIVLPVRLLARWLLAEIKAWSEKGSE